MANDRVALDAILKLADKALQEFQGILVITDRVGVVKKLRSLADLFERWPMLENDIAILRSRIRGMMSTDPDRTPVTGISAEMAAIREARRTTTPGGIAIPLPVLPVRKIPREDPR